MKARARTTRCAAGCCLIKVIAIGVAVSPDEFHLYVAEDAAALAIRERDGDAGVWLVSTLPTPRAGKPLYTRLGYEKLGSIGMWEKRA